MHPRRKASGPHIFVRVNHAFHEHGYGPFLGEGGVGSIDVYGLGATSKPTKDTSSDQSIDSLVSLCNDFADRTCSNIVSH